MAAKQVIKYLRKYFNEMPPHDAYLPAPIARGSGRNHIINTFTFARMLHTIIISVLYRGAPVYTFGNGGCDETRTHIIILY